MILFLNFWKKKILNWIFENFWIFVRCHPSVLSHHALETAECDESYYIERGGIIFGRRGAGNSFTMSHTATRWSSWPYTDFNFFFVTSVPGGGLCPYMAYGRGLPIYGSALAPWVFWGAKKPHTLLLLYILINCFFKLIVDIFLTNLNIKSHIY